MKHYSIHDKYIALSASSSKGTQIKYFKNNNWYKLDNVGMEGLAEEITSKLLQCSNHADYVMYEKGVINGKNGCKSANFLGLGKLRYLTMGKGCCRIIIYAVPQNHWIYVCRRSIPRQYRAALSSNIRLPKKRTCELTKKKSSESCRIIDARILWDFWNGRWIIIIFYFIKEAKPCVEATGK